MGKIILSEFISLDGIAQNPSWAVPYWGEDIANVKFDELIEAEALLLGKNTFDMFALAWPGKSDADGYADRINAMPKYVVTSHRNPLSWNGVGILADPDEIRNLKAKIKGNLLVIGSLSLVHLLLEEKLADEVRIFLYPLLVKEGRKLFESLESDFELVSQQSFQSGVVELRYKVK